MEQLKYFENEIKEAGGVDNLMFQKGSIKTGRGNNYDCKL